MTCLMLPSYFWSGTMPGCSGPTATACSSPVTYGSRSNSSLTSSTSRLRFRMPDVMLSRASSSRLTTSSVSPSTSSSSRYYPPTSRPLQSINSRSYDVSSHISPSSDWSYSSSSYERRYSTTGRSSRHSSITDDPDIVSTRYLSTRDRDSLSTTAARTARERFDSREREMANGTSGLSTTASRATRDSTHRNTYTDSYTRSKSGSVDFGRTSRAISHDDTKTSATSGTSPSTTTARSRATSTAATSISTVNGERPPIKSRFLKKIQSEREAASAAEKSEDADTVADTANNNTNTALVNGVSNDDNGNPERRSSVANLCQKFDPSLATRSSPKPSSVEKELRKEESPVTAAAADTPVLAAVTPIPIAERNGTGGPLVGGCAPQEDKPLVNGTARLSRISTQRASSPAQSSDSLRYELDHPRPTRRPAPAPAHSYSHLYHPSTSASYLIRPGTPLPAPSMYCSPLAPRILDSLFPTGESCSSPALRGTMRSWSSSPLVPASTRGLRTRACGPSCLDLPSSYEPFRRNEKVLSPQDIYDSPRIVRRSLSHAASTGGGRSGGLNGLRNIGNTCFMNSVIQCLSNTRPLLEYLQKQNYTSEINTTNSSMKGALIEAFAKMIKELWTGEDNIVDTTAFKRQIQHFAPRFMGYSQQDAQEFLRYLLEGLHEDVNRVETRPRNVLPDIDDSLSENQKADESWRRYLRLDDSAVVDIFVGQLKSTLRCTSCGHASVTFDPFWDLSLPLPSRTQLRLTQCLEHFTREEVLDGDEKPTCAKCKTRKKCTKSFSIQKFPKILVLHLKRFSPNERFRGKLNVNVEFPLTGLDLTEYAANRERAVCTYNLYGVANHSGTTYSGHYTAYCKHPYSGDWHEYDDSKVSTISTRSIGSSEAYVLFYELARQSSHL